MPPGTLFVVGTPLGNLSDITPRAIESLRRAAIVACEDTRRTRGLLEHFGIKPPRVISCHHFNEKRRLEGLMEALQRGESVALVTDGGTPSVSDPGSLVVEAALARGLPVSPIPGPSAVAAALSVCGFTADSFLFAGFLPARGGPRRRALESLRAEPRTLVFFEAPHRIVAAAADMLAVLGDRRVTMARELTKLHEEVRRASLSGLVEDLRSRKPPGEYTLVVEGAGDRPAAPTTRPDGRAAATPEQLRRRYAEMIESGTDRATALKALVRETGLTRREVYSAVRPGDGG